MHWQLTPTSIAAISKDFLPVGKSLLLTDDVQPGRRGKPSINSGVFLIINDDWAVQFWKSVWNEFPEAINDPAWEQRAIYLYRDTYPGLFLEHAEVVPRQIMNSLWGWGFRPTAFIVHAGGGHSKWWAGKKYGIFVSDILRSIRGL